MTTDPRFAQLLAIVKREYSRIWFFDSWGGLWESHEFPPYYGVAAAFGPTGIATPAAQPEGGYMAARAAGLVEEEGGWEFFLGTPPGEVTPEEATLSRLAAADDDAHDFGMDD